MTRQILERAVERVVLDDHDGRSGARLERVRLDDGTRLIVKRAEPNRDLTMLLTGKQARERALWSAGVLDRLPDGVGHAIIAVWDDDGVTVTVMRDLADTVPGWSRVLSRDECGRILQAMTAMHAEFAGNTPAVLCTLELRLTLLSARTMAPLANGPDPLPGLVVRGWQRFTEFVEPELADAVFALHDDPAALAAAMRVGTTTMIHSDLWPVNLALEPDAVVLIDWALATAGPPAMDLAIFLTGAAAHIEPTREELVEEFRQRSGALCDDRAIRLALLAGLMELGWNKAIDAAEHADPQTRARARADLDWWTQQTRTTLDQRLF